MDAYALVATRLWGAPEGLPGFERGGRVDVLALFLRLLVTTLLPIIAGCAVRALWPAARRNAKRYKKRLSMLSTLFLALIVWQSLSTARPALLRQPFLSLLWVFLLSLAQHLFYYAFNLAACVLMGLNPLETTAVTVMASQKSAPVGFAVAGSVARDAGAFGLIVSAIVANQLDLIFGSAAVAAAFRPRNERFREAERERKKRAGVEEEVDEVDRSRAETASTVGRLAV